MGHGASTLPPSLAEPSVVRVQRLRKLVRVRRRKHQRSRALRMNHLVENRLERLSAVLHRQQRIERAR